MDRKASLAEQRANVAFRTHQRRAAAAGIPFEFTFEDWWDWWQTEDRWSRRGNGMGKLVMARFGDQGPYNPTNVYCCTFEQNSRDARLTAKRARVEKQRAYREETVADGTISIIGERALLARIRRKLAQEGENLLWDRGGRLGYYIVNNRNLVVAQDCDPLELAKELDCIRPWERLEDSK